MIATIKASRRQATTAATILTAVLVILTASCAMPEIRITTPPFTTLADGAYEGSYDGGMVKATVKVTIASGAISNVTILRHDCGKGKPAEVIVNDVVAKQSLDVDVISGASYSSKVILKAIENALVGAAAN